MMIDVVINILRLKEYKINGIIVIVGVLVMYIDLAVVLILLIVVVVFFRKFSSFVYAFAIIDIFLRIMTFIKNNTVPELKSLIGKYLPESIAAIIGRYSSGLVYTLLMWLYVIIFAIFLGYITNYFIHKRK